MTPNKEDYVKAIYTLGGTEELISNKQIAEALQVSPASVTEMLGKLKNEGLIHYEAYKGSRLTAQGTQVAMSLVRGHRLWEVFLIDHLNYSWSEAHEDAELLEHITPLRLVSRLDTFLNYPEHCPHGRAIPRLAAEVEHMPLQSLNQLSVGERSYIRFVIEEKELLDYLQQAGISIGSSVRIVEAGAYEGPFTLDLDGKRIQISYKAASQIYVDQADHEEV